VDIAFGADNSSPTVDAVRSHLHSLGHKVSEAHSPHPWPVMAKEVAREVVDGEAERGVLLCWTSTGTAMAANKVRGARAISAWEPWIAKNARLWNDANILTLSLRRTAPDVAIEIVDAFLSVEEPDPDEAENIRLIESEDS
jgi:ribose 5-phosphate isomerase B